MADPEKKARKGHYEAFAHPLVRAPVLPFERFRRVNAETNPAGLDEMDGHVSSAIQIGSPSLMAAFERPASDEREGKSREAKLRRFVTRMATRPTPYGMFAGVALAEWGAITDLALTGEPRTRTRVDMDWLCRYVMQLETFRQIRSQLDWVRDSGAWVDHGRVILAPRARAPAQLGNVSIAATPTVRRALELARSPTPYTELVAELVSDGDDRRREKVEALLDELWRLGILLTDLMPPITCPDPLGWVVDRLSSLRSGRLLDVQLAALRSTIEACDGPAGEDRRVALERAVTHLSLLGRTDTELPLQVDTALGLEGTRVSAKVATEAARLAEALLRLTPFPGGPPHVARYREQFLGRYGPDRDVPVLELVQPEWGLGPVPRSGGGGQSSAQHLEVLQSLAIEAIRDHRTVVRLDKELLDHLATMPLEVDALPTSVDLNVFVLATSREAIDSGAFQLMVGPNLGASAAGRNLGRFVPLLGATAHEALGAMAAHDESFSASGTITAEIAWLPQRFRTTNVAVRPVARRYEIVRGVSAGVDADHVIPLDELVVGVRQGRFSLRWQATGQEVICASGTMLNFHQAPPEIQLLMDLSYDGRCRLSAFDWGRAHDHDFVPRVEYGRSILQCAQWRLRASAVAKALDSEHAFAEWVARWRAQWSVPDLVYLTSADNRMLHDLNDPDQVQELRREFRRDGQAPSSLLLQEALPGPEHAWLPDGRGEGHVVELVVSLGLHPVPEHGAPPAFPPISLTATGVVPKQARRRLPGSDWLFLKLYGPRSAQDEVLSTSVRALVGEVGASGEADGWFFIRYADPDPHLRLRFHGKPDDLLHQLLPRLCGWATELVEGGTCHRFEFETYEREVDRYGGDEATTLAEQLFAADSGAVVDLLALGSDVDRSLLALVSVDRLLAALGLDEPARAAWFKGTAATALRETSKEFRSRREQFVAMLSDPAALPVAVAGSLDERDRLVAAVADQLEAMAARGGLPIPIERLCESYIHMHFNRLFGERGVERRVLSLLARTRELLAHREPRDVAHDLASV